MAAAPTTPSIRFPRTTVLCWMRIKNRVEGDRRQCTQEFGHKGLHAWQYCRHEFVCQGGFGHYCELPDGHPGDVHRSSVEWRS